MESFDPSGCSIKGWLCTIARNNALDLLRRKRREYDQVALEDAAVRRNGSSQANLRWSGAEWR
ncbi:MAG: sigma-70 family RNA polymerase sigma factor [Clostridia bacterium]|nr:sigma-70 family RNA polymerase sigma factor [Clostridia bacterium]